MKEQKHFPLNERWLLLGDKSRFLFAQWVTGISVAEWEQLRKQARISSGDKFSWEKREDGAWYISSIHAPMGIEICLFSDDEWEEEKDEYLDFQRCIVLEGYPWGQESTRQNLELESVRLLPKSLVLVVSHHRRGSTDLDTVEEVLSEKRFEYEKDNELKVYVLRCAKDLLKLISQRDTILQKYKKYLGNQLGSLSNRIEAIEIDYVHFLEDCEELSTGAIGERAFSVIRNYDTVIRISEPQLWQCYNKAAVARLFPVADKSKGTLNALADMYEELLVGEDMWEDSLPGLAGWDMIEERQNLLDCLKQGFVEYMQPPESVHNPFVCEFHNETEYLDVANKGIIVDYQKRLREYVRCEAKRIFTEYVKNCHDVWERMII